MNVFRRWKRRNLAPPDACPYVKCREPMKFVEVNRDGPARYDVFECIGPDKHRWNLPARTEHRPPEGEE